MNDFDKPLLIEAQYWGSVAYYRLMVKHETVFLEAHEHFQKSSYRNRCEIATPEGRLTLSVPLEGGRLQRKTMSKIRLLEVENWQQQHWQSLCFSYRRTPYFEYYEDRLEVFYQQKYTSLFSMNKQLIELIIKTLDLPIELEESTSFVKKDTASEFSDARSAIRPNKVLPNYVETIKYHQLFEDRHGFLENLSILDLLFNEGPQAANLLMR